MDLHPFFGHSSQFPDCPKADSGWLLFECPILGHSFRFWRSREMSASAMSGHLRTQSSDVFEQLWLGEKQNGRSGTPKRDGSRSFW
jgi:hypothetical protein